jgi:hypothetical protein
MSLGYSRNLINEIAGRKEAEEYINGLLKDPDMQADMESAAASKWDGLTQERGMIAPAQPEPELERER